MTKKEATAWISRATMPGQHFHFVNASWEYWHFSGALKLIPEFGLIKKSTFCHNFFFTSMQWYNKAAAGSSYCVKLLTAWAFCWIVEKVNGLHLTHSVLVISTEVSPYSFILIHVACELGCHTFLQHQMMLLSANMLFLNTQETNVQRTCISIQS